MTYSLSIPTAPPSANVYLRLHWSRRQKLSLSWSYLLLEAGVASIPKATAKRRIDILFSLTRLRDEPNLMLCADKLILDNLVKFGVLVDDSPTWLELSVSQRKSSRSRTVVTVSDLC